MNPVFWSLANLIFTVAGALLAILTAVRALLAIRNYGVGNRPLWSVNLWYAASIALGTAGVAIFLFTQDVTGMMTFSDEWTILCASIFSAEIPSHLLAFE